MCTLTQIINNYNYVNELDDKLLETMETMKVVPESARRLHRIYGSALQRIDKERIECINFLFTKFRKVAAETPRICTIEEDMRITYNKSKL